MPFTDIPSRRQALGCMAMASGAVIWTLRGGVPVRAASAGAGFSFAQISDTHIGFGKEPNPDPAATLTDALARLKAADHRPALLLHTGDVTHLSRPAEFERAAALMQTAGLETYYVPGEHDVIDDNGAAFFARFGRSPQGWYSFDQGGVHFVGLVNVLNLTPGGLGSLGAEQRAWLAADLKARSASTPIVLFAHMPLWNVYAPWGWGTDDATEALAPLKRFGSVTVLNGHIHQVIQKVEGHLTFETARSTAFPQAAPGEGPGPGPLKVPAERLRAMLGLRHVTIARQHVTVGDEALEA